MPLTQERRRRKPVFTMRVTAVNHAETVNDTGIPSDNTWVDQNVGYGIFVKGVRVDKTNNLTTIAVIHSTMNGGIWYPNVGDYVMVEEAEDASLPRVLGGINSFSSNIIDPVENPQPDTWDAAVKSFARPIPPSLELPGNRGDFYTYNPMYMTFHPNYEPTDPVLGTWYDRFVKFDSSVTYKNKKTLSSYNEDWVEQGLQSRDNDVRVPLLNMVENIRNPARLEDSFYLTDNRWPYRADPVYDTLSPEHPSNNANAVVRSAGGGSLMVSAVEDWDSYPMPLSLQGIGTPQLQFTAYDEMVNETLSQIRTNAQNLTNADVPLEPKEEQQIRIGRNKLIIADVHGDGTNILLTLKTAVDQQLTMLFQDDGATQKSQVRLRGMYGEGLLLESQGSGPGDATSRLFYKGTDGQVFEVFDSSDSQNYIYMLSSDGGNSGEGYGLGRASYVLITNDTVPGSNQRVLNNPNIPPLNNGRMVTMGVYDSAQDYVASNTLHFDGTNVSASHGVRSGNSVASDSQSINVNTKAVSHSVTRSFNSDELFITDSFTVDTGVSLFTRRAASAHGGTFIDFMMDGVIPAMSFANNFDTSIQIQATDIILKTNGNLFLGDDSLAGMRPVARLGDRVRVAGFNGTIVATEQTKVVV